MEIDVTYKVEFIEKLLDEDDFEPSMFIRCVCGKEFEYSVNQYDEETKLCWSCPECKAKIYFRPLEEEHRTKLIQVIDD